MKKIIIFIVLTSILAVSCSKNKPAKVTVNVPDAPDSTEVIISKLDINKIVNIDTIDVINNKISFKASVKKGCPDFYYVYYKDRKLVSLVINSGDKIRVKTSLNNNDDPIIDGSSESLELLKVDNQFAEVYSDFLNLSKEMEQASIKDDKQKIEKLKRELGSLYVKQKQHDIKYVMSNSKSICVIPVMYRKFTDQLPVFGQVNDVLIFKSVYDSLQTVYPNSPYVLALADDISKKESYLNIKNKINNAPVLSHPDISMPDVNSKVRNLSEFDGKVIILMFWSSKDANQKIFNNDLKKLYKRYHSRGLEVYQVSLDIDKTAWASVVKSQELPWVNVCNGLGTSTPAAIEYNIKNIPSMFIIDKEGSIVAKNLFNVDKLDKQISKLIK